MKGSLVFATILVLLSPSFSFNIHSPNSSGVKLLKTGFMRLSNEAARIGADKCGLCINFMGQAIQELIDIIANVGIVGGCSTVCGLLPQQVLQVACSLICDIVGIEEFVKFINKEDPDPILICEDFKLCPIKDDGDAKITQLDVTPKSGPQGEFVISFTYVSKNGTGTGEIDVDIKTVDGLPVGQGFLHEEAPAGTYPANIQLKAEPDPQCDPTQQPCEQWMPGSYTVRISICNGECGSKHPHSQIYDQAETTFTITG